VNAQKIPETQKIDVLVSLTVVEHDAPVVKARWSVDRQKGNGIGTILVIVLTSPFWFPLLLIVAIDCEITGCR
jgi:hypothetical protein